MTRARLFITLACLALIGSLGASAWYGARLLADRRDNALIGDLARGRDLAVDPQARPPVLYARVAFLTARDRLDEAQPLVNRIAASDDAGVAIAAQYELANARLRTAIEHLQSNDIDPAVPLVRLAKEGYRRALALDPDFWDAKYNLDVAMRLVRDFPQIEVDGEEIPPEAAKRLWTDLPGLPKGLP
ncbi:hypothetical protein [Ancylobacter terrae]|uniref:hypothetical protein n=1 Tax=Ancylobacter sp. sgz301288 TaxID=3342077 RepID=UPI00385E7B12